MGQQEAFLPLRSRAWAGPDLAKVSGGHRAWKWALSVWLVPLLSMPWPVFTGCQVGGNQMPKSSE